MIRKYKEEDTNAVVSSWRAASELAHPFLESQFLDSEAIALRDVYLKYAETWVVEIDESVVGFIAMAENEVAGLFLKPEYHGQGLGTALLNHVAANHVELTVDVFKKNNIGRRFYDRYGFRKVGEFVHESSGQETIKMIYFQQ